jgi:hypothetical protein
MREMCSAGVASDEVRDEAVARAAELLERPERWLLVHRATLRELLHAAHDARSYRADFERVRAQMLGPGSNGGAETMIEAWLAREGG